MPASPSDALCGKPLTPRQQRFVQEILVDGVVAAAARRAGYSGKSSLYSCNQLMKNPRVMAAIEAERARRAAPWTRETATRALRQIAEANVLDYARPGPDGTLELDLWRLERDQAGPVKALSVVEKTDPVSGAVTRTVGFTLADRASALMKLASVLESEEDGRAERRGWVQGAEAVAALTPAQLGRFQALWAKRRRRGKGAAIDVTLRDFLDEEALHQRRELAAAEVALSAREKAMERAEYVLQESWGDLEFHRQRVDDQKDALDERSQALARAEAALKARGG
jgi:phage terminase small subunit